MKGFALRDEYARITRAEVVCPIQEIDSPNTDHQDIWIWCHTTAAAAVEFGAKNNTAMLSLNFCDIARVADTVTTSQN